MGRLRPDIRLERVLLAFGADLAEATDEEVWAAADDLGLKPSMKGTVAFIGLKHFVAPYPRSNWSGATMPPEWDMAEDDLPPKKPGPGRDGPDRT